MVVDIITKNFLDIGSSVARLECKVCLPRAAGAAAAGRQRGTMVARIRA
jgi:hypothetical protein